MFEENSFFMIPVIMKKLAVESMPTFPSHKLCYLLHLLVAWRKTAYTELLLEMHPHGTHSAVLFISFLLSLEFENGHLNLVFSLS